MLADLHTHTWHSDGALPPAQLLALARDKGVQMLAVTDHDSMAASADPAYVSAPGLQVIHGIELSTQWRGQGIHVVGLDVDAASPVLQAGITAQKAARATRAAHIARRLARLGIDGALEGARAFARGDYLGRPHFAQFLVHSGAARDPAQAFRKYLGAGKPGDVKNEWAELATAVGWIRAAGGVSVLAHPAKYRMTRARERLLVGDFVAAGGQALEVISGRQQPEVTARLRALCRDAQLLASCGSDFHAGDRAWAALGEGLTLPAGLTPVWAHWA
jgi:predicted metal-dependent phosphoesterase TrpH